MLARSHLITAAREQSPTFGGRSRHRWGIFPLSKIGPSNWESSNEELWVSPRLVILNMTVQISWVKGARGTLSDAPEDDPTDQMRPDGAISIPGWTLDHVKDISGCVWVWVCLGVDPQREDSTLVTMKARIMNRG